MKRVHLIDDDPLLLSILDMLLEHEGFLTTAHNSAQHFLSTPDAQSAGCVVTDVDMPEMSGLELAAEMPRQGIDCPVIIITGHCSTEKKAASLQNWSFQLFRKTGQYRHARR